MAENGKGDNGNGGNGAAAPAAGQAGAQAGAQAAGQPQVKVQVLAQFVRDMSFENAVAQNNMTLPQGQPDIQVQVSLDARKRDTEHQFEVISKFRIESKTKEDGKTLFLVELEYGGVFHIEGVPQEQMHPFLLIECPRILFPFARRIISDVTRDGGFPALNLDLIDFMALYRQELARQSQKGQAGGGAAPAA
ncbi:protein-export chaperone SecB [Pararhodobacter sp. SW119]|uniref:protein-export chaperone SecB n=1 Tax=Pararhodobacter sp. SW119 TaxID=2780075 RepID=UPI001AE0DF2C|nr:protein-export chaperone SecB [Pararhodobacter sp. SW119]